MNSVDYHSDLSANMSTVLGPPVHRDVSEELESQTSRHELNNTNSVDICDHDSHGFADDMYQQENGLSSDHTVESQVLSNTVPNLSAKEEVKEKVILDPSICNNVHPTHFQSRQKLSWSLTRTAALIP